MKQLVNVFLPREFVEKIDREAQISGATRSDILRRSIELYLKQAGESL